MMESCEPFAGALARRADGADEIAEQRVRLDAHLAGCASCRATLASQRAVRDALRARGYDRVTAAFEAGLRTRLDDSSGWLGLIDWRVWTFRLAPVAVALALAGYLTTGTSAGETSTLTLDEWTRNAATAAQSDAAVLWQPEVNSESLLESLLIGRTASGGDGDVR